MSDKMPKLPEGCVHLSGNLYRVKFKDIRLPEDQGSSDEYSFTNSRTLTELGQQTILDNKLSSDLRQSIASRTLLNPLTCRWVSDGNGFYPQLVGGERRYHALSYLIRKKSIVSDPRKSSLDENGVAAWNQAPADEAYEYIDCSVFAVNDDLEALALSWAENKTRVDLVDGHEIAEVIRLRKFGASDERITDILQRDSKWLADTDSLIKNLDANTLQDLIENRIDRHSAIALCSIKDVAHRDKVRQAAYDAAKENAEVRIKRLQKRIESTLDVKEAAEASLADARFSKDNEKILEAENILKNADKKIKDTQIKQKKLDAGPVTTVQDVKNVASKLEQDDDPDKQIEPQRFRILSYKKILGLNQYIDELIESNIAFDVGRSEESVVYSDKLEEFKLVKHILSKIILDNNDDFEFVIRSYLEQEPKKKK